jgi:hypothetical protein
MVPLMWTLPTLVSAAMAFFNHASVGVPGATAVTGVVAVVGAAAGAAAGAFGAVVVVAAVVLAPARSLALDQRPDPAPDPAQSPDPTPTSAPAPRAIAPTTTTRVPEGKVRLTTQKGSGCHTA